LRFLAPALAALLVGACASSPPRPPPSGPNAISDAAAASNPAAASAAASGAAAAFVADAAALIGQPYRFGGAAPGGFDCSGLVQYAAHQAGLDVPRTAAEQLRAGAPVARRDVRGGDLVFMRLKGKELHVGIALGDGRFVHAPSAGSRVRIDSLAAAPYARRFLAARRIVPAPRRSRTR
jgi:cell wall-associated NlpC family hydrolase